jgi:hypothetical protein
MEPATVVVEFYGIPRQRAGRANLAVQARTIAEALQAAERACPPLAGLMQQGTLAPHLALSIDGRVFTHELERRLTSGERILLMSADAGG